MCRSYRIGVKVGPQYLCRVMLSAYAMLTVANVRSAERVPL